jgi:hypothetical protein
MRLFQTIAQIIIATSVVNCAALPPVMRVAGPSGLGQSVAGLSRDPSVYYNRNLDLEKRRPKLNKMNLATLIISLIGAGETTFALYNLYVRSFPTLSCHVNISDLRSHLSGSKSPPSTTSSSPPSATSSSPHSTASSSPPSTTTIAKRCNFALFC